MDYKKIKEKYESLIPDKYRDIAETTFIRTFVIATLGFSTINMGTFFWAKDFLFNGPVIRSEVLEEKISEMIDKESPLRRFVINYGKPGRELAYYLYERD